MIGMMAWQKGKDFTAVLLEMKENDGKQVKLIEIVLIVITVGIVFFICFINVAAILFFYFDIKIVDFDTLVIMFSTTDAFIVVELVISFKGLVSLMSKYHDKRYQEVRKQLLFFFVFETLPNAWFVIHNCILYMYR